MTRNSPAAAREIEAGLDRSRPYRTLSELLAEHRALMEFAAQVRDAPAGSVSPGLRLAAALAFARCDRLTAAKP